MLADPHALWLALRASWRLVLEDRLFLLFLAFALNALLLSYRHLSNLPVLSLPGDRLHHFTRAAERKLNREKRGFGTLAMRGMLLTLFLCTAGFAVGEALERLRPLIPFGWAIDVIILAGLLLWRTLMDGINELATRQHDMSLYEARNRLNALSDFDHEVMDIHGVNRHAAEMAVLAFTERFLGVIFFYLLFGLSGALMYYALWHLVRVVDYPHERFLMFGRVAAMLFNLLSALPRLYATVVFLFAGFFTPGAENARAFSALTHARLIPFRLLPVHLAAVLAEMQLGGHKRRRDVILAYPWVGKGTPMPLDTHLRTVARLLQVSTMITLGLMALAYLKLGR